MPRHLSAILVRSASGAGLLAALLLLVLGVTITAILVRSASRARLLAALLLLVLGVTITAILPWRYVTLHVPRPITDVELRVELEPLWTLEVDGYAVAAFVEMAA